MSHYNKELITACITALQSVIDQGVPSMALMEGRHTTTCAYRGSSDTRCAVGWLISDEHYKTSLEGKSPGNAGVARAISKSLGITISGDEKELLCSVQRVHDFAAEDIDSKSFVVAVNGQISRLLRDNVLPDDFKVLL